ncbi:DUF4199 domain-containing protein [Belliella sp. R4-6]|uniref:DUF4199 domain-containing protein n=1 Tax=Belliella alkalica TaxID=1730871 RepID=A0ABS9VC03_9BACT|nr:DUF4199 domain-containing protein [Belliella alkalica]MCH7413769.1 DUF4199 domain-containing protein [Belliella alkalica]
MEEKITIGDSVKKWGLIYGLIGLIAAILTAIFDLATKGAVMSIVTSLITVAIAFGIYFLATKEYRESNDGLLSFGEGFKIVALIGLLGGTIRAIGTYCYFKFIDTGYMDRVLEAQIEAQENMGVPYDPDAIPEFMKFFQTVEFQGIASILSAILGFLIWGLIAVAINKKTEEY